MKKLLLALTIVGVLSQNANAFLVEGHATDDGKNIIITVTDLPSALTDKQKAQLKHDIEFCSGVRPNLSASVYEEN